MSTETNGKPANAVEAFARLEAKIASLDAKIDRLLAHLGINGARPSNAGASGNVASLADIQGQYGDIEIKKDPPRWKGKPMAPCRASQCPPEYLEIVADFLDWKADNPRPGKEKYATYERRDAGRCRRWSIEIREGRYKQEPMRDDDSGPPPGADDDYGASDDPPPGGGDYPDDAGPPPDEDTPF